jgi:glycosyltransferase involved in cell wall biosynthesis
MKILQVIDSLALGGAEVLAANLYTGLRERGLFCEYYLLRGERTPLERKLADLGARIHVPLRASVYSPRHLCALRELLREFEYDLVHVHLFPAQLWAACGSWAARSTAPLITTEHSTETRRRAFWFRGIDRWMYGRYRRIASISPATTMQLIAWLPELRDKVADCPNGVDVESFAPTSGPGKQALFSVTDGTPVILCVGRLETVKDHETLLRAMSLVPGAVLALAGDGPLWKPLHALADQLGIAARVQFLGRRMDVPQLLKAADLYVQPSRWEGLSIAVLEAMAAGKPIVVSDTPSLAEQVEDAALLFPVGDAPQLALRIATLLANSELRQQLACLAQQRARMFSLTRTLDCYERLYRDVTQRAAT